MRVESGEPQTGRPGSHRLVATEESAATVGGEMFRSLLWEAHHFASRGDSECGSNRSVLRGRPRGLRAGTFFDCIQIARSLDE